MRTLPLLVLTLAACGGSPKPSALGNAAGYGGPPGPAPTIAWSGGAPMNGGEFTIAGMPAVADDGSRVLIGWQQGDGGRGYPNLRLQVVDRADQVVDNRLVLDADQVEDLGEDATVDVTAHNQYLTDSNGAMRWRPLATAPVEAVTAEVGSETADEDGASQWTATLGDVSVHFDIGAHLVIAQGGKVVVDNVMDGWLTKDHLMYEGASEDESCSNPIYLDRVHVDGGRHVAVIGVEYHGNDSCWEPTGQAHVVAW